MPERERERERGKLTDPLLIPDRDVELEVIQRR